MKAKKMFELLFLALLFTAFATPTLAQDTKKEVEAFAKQFQDTYNKADHAGLAKLCAKEVVVTNPDGTATTLTNVQMGENYAKGFANADLQITITVGEITTLPDGKVKVIGTTTLMVVDKKTGEKRTQKTTYENVAVKENGEWKLCAIKQTPVK
jgi:uncharacterized protein (TIGR02246 family)